MRAQAVLRQRAASTVFGAMHRASQEVRHQEMDASENAVPFTPTSAPPSSASSSSFVMPCLAQLPSRAVATQEPVAAQHTVGPSTSVHTEEARLSLSELCALVAQCLHRGPERAGREPETIRSDAMRSQARAVESTAAADGQEDLDVEALLDALEGYNPTFDASLVARVAQRVNVSVALEQARHLLALAHTTETLPTQQRVANVEAMGEEDDEQARSDRLVAFRTLLRRWQAERQALSVSPTSSAASGPARAKSRGAEAVTKVSAEAEAWRVAEEEAGIVVRLHFGQGTNRQRLSGVLADVGDVQVSEVLPDGQVVTFTQATLPEDEAAVPWKGKHRHNLVASLETLFSPTSSPLPAVVYLHFIVYKHDVPLAALFRFLAAVIGDDLVQPDDFTASQELEEKAAAVQTCVLRVVIPHNVREGREGRAGPAVDYCRHIARRLMEVNVAAARPATTTPLSGSDHTDKHDEQPPPSLAENTLASTPVAIQLLEWLPAMPDTLAQRKKTASSVAAPVNGGVQYMFLVRGVSAPRGAPAQYVENVVQQSLAAMPNFFAPVHFGHVGSACPFKTYHVSAAMAHGRWAEALMMAVVLALWPTSAESSCWSSGMAGRTSSSPAAPWVVAVFAALASGEDRAAVLRSLWQTRVPQAVRTHLTRATSALLWNVVASCRLHEWKQHKTGKHVGLLDADRAVAGDFVWRHTQSGCHNNSDGNDDATHKQVPAHKSESVFTIPALVNGTAALENGKSDAAAACRGRASAVRALLTTADMPAPAISDVVIPLVENDVQLAMCPALHTLGVALGLLPTTARAAMFSAPTASVSAAAVPPFRALLIRGTGYPQAARPWVKAFAEPSHAASVSADRASGATSAQYRLATDLALAAARGVGRDFAAVSRGRQGAVWPLGRRGRSMVERLPDGLLAVSALSASPSPSRAQRRPHRPAVQSQTSWCLVLHVTLPAAAYSGNFLRECLVLHDHRLHRRQPLQALAERLALECGRRGGDATHEVRPVAVHAQEAVKEAEEDSVDGNLLFLRGSGGVGRRK